ncbi:hypothetical protein [Pseudovibrio sp. SPO723]|uniref:hypothetical protein n=1 Tax=Nesiotobacter zosterae TaxID=392721 RepID=UPI0029C5CBC6|nr:hypothetical protein [Pseudovibrio sp. SPO723]MDX5593441.1 hypothetical protein [Pseudovibrio sp. SPO723]
MRVSALTAYPHCHAGQGERSEALIRYPEVRAFGEAGRLDPGSGAGMTVVMSARCGMAEVGVWV